MATFSCNSIVGSSLRQSALLRARGQLQHTRATRRLPIRSLAASLVFASLLAATLLVTTPPAARAQYPGHIDTSKPANGSSLRAIAVLEWTGPSGKPTASRLIPITVYDGTRLHDANLYLSQPIPLALQSGYEYELQSAGTPIGLYDLYSAGHNPLVGLDSWQGYGTWRPLPKPAPPSFNASSLHITGLNQDEPVLLRKHPKDSSQTGSQTGNQAGNQADAKSPTTAPGGSGPVDPDRPKLRHLPTASSTEATSSAEATSPPLRETGLNSPDPNRPHLSYGKPKNLPTAAQQLQGTPPAMHQLVAVSDATASAPHPWTYSWPSPFDEANVRRALEAIARAALTPPAKPGSPALAPPPSLAQESFRSFELEYGAAPTMVFSASTLPPDESQSSSKQPSTTQPSSNPPTPPQRFVTLIAQPDLYGNPIVLQKIVTDSAHLDETPRPRLIDAVDAKGDGRAELLFELLGDHQRTFALYSVLNGSVQPLFTTIPIP